MNTLVVNFWGGPGSGKSTLAAATFAELKCRGVSCELVFEYVKTWAWESRVPSKYDELYIFGQQVRRETLLYGKVPVVLTDRPLELSGFYASEFGQPRLGQAMDAAVAAVRNTAIDDGHRFLDVFVQRSSEYDPKGRYQTETEARQLDERMRRISLYQFEVTKSEHKEIAALVQARLARSASDPK